MGLRALRRPPTLLVFEMFLNISQGTTRVQVLWISTDVILVLEMGLEPTRPRAYASETYVSTIPPPELIFLDLPNEVRVPLSNVAPLRGCSFSEVWLSNIRYRSFRTAHLPLHHPSKWCEYIQMKKIANVEKKVIIFLCLHYQQKISSTTSNTHSKNCSRPSSGISYDPLSYSLSCCR